MSSRNPPIVRAAYLHLYFDLFREIGIPTTRALAHSRLPGLVEEQSDTYVSLPLALECLARNGSALTPMDLGFHASRSLSLDSFDPYLHASLNDSVSGLERSRRYFQLLAIEDNSLVPGIRREGGHVRLSMKMPRLDQHPHACLAEWINVQALVTILRSIAGSGWCPIEITLASRLPASQVSFETFPNTRILVGQKSTSILVAREVLVSSCVSGTDDTALDVGALARDDHTAMESWSFKSALRSLIEPYICEGRADLAMAADLVGVSRRTLQRRLKNCNTSYAEILQEARFRIARSQLSDEHARVCDVATMCGYENPQHFSSVFRQMTGLSPSEFSSSRPQ